MSKRTLTVLMLVLLLLGVLVPVGVTVLDSGDPATPDTRPDADLPPGDAGGHGRGWEGIPPAVPGGGEESPEGGPLGGERGALPAAREDEEQATEHSTKSAGSQRRASSHDLLLGEIAVTGRLGCHAPSKNNAEP